MPPTDPLIYRLYELVLVNGPAMKLLIEEEFGDGIMSAIDFDMTIDRQPDPKGDRVKLAMTRQVPAVQVLRRDRQRAGVWVQGGVGARPRIGHASLSARRNCRLLLVNELSQGCPEAKMPGAFEAVGFARNHQVT